MTTLDGRRTLPGGTRALDRAPMARYVPARRRRPGFAGLIARDLATIVGVWAVTAYPILWLSIHVIGPALFGGTP